jgi:hypothetical protein
MCRYPSLRKHGQDRLCWLMQKRAVKRSCIERLKAKEIAYILLMTLLLLALDIAPCDLPNRVKTFFTYLGN